MTIFAAAELPQYIKKLRGDLTQAEYGELLGVSKQAVTQYESGQTQPKSDVLEKLGLEKCYRVTGLNRGAKG